MHPRKLLAVTFAALVALAAVGCSSSSKDEENVSADTSAEEASSGQRDSTKDEGEAPSTTEDERDGGSSSGGDTDLIPGEGRFEDCMEVGLTYAGIYLSALGAASDADREAIQRSLDEVKGKVPQDIQDDLQVVADGIAQADGFAEIGEFFESEEYKQADENITRYLEETCGTTSG